MDRQTRTVRAFTVRSDWPLSCTNRIRAMVRDPIMASNRRMMTAFMIRAVDIYVLFVMDTLCNKYSAATRQIESPCAYAQGFMYMDLGTPLWGVRRSGGSAINRSE